MVNGAAKLPAEAAGASAEIVNEIGKSAYAAAAGAGGVSKGAALVKRWVLARKLAQEIGAKAEGMLAAHQAHGVLVLPVIGEPELGNIVCATKASDSQACIERQVGMEWVRSGQRKIKPDAAIVKAKFVGRPGIDHVSVAE